jgi:hypothetical protein
LKEVFKKRPMKLKYDTIWDISPVLSFLEKLHPLNQLKLKEAAEKIATLLAITTAH